MSKTTKPRKPPAQIRAFEDAKLAQIAEGLDSAKGLLRALVDLLPTLSPDALGRAYETLKDTETALGNREGTGALDEIKSALLMLTAKKGDDKGTVLTPHYRITRTDLSRRTLKKDQVQQALINRGVKPDIVREALEEGTAVTETAYARVTRRKGV